MRLSYSKAIVVVTGIGMANLKTMALGQTGGRNADVPSRPSILALPQEVKPTVPTSAQHSVPLNQQKQFLSSKQNNSRINIEDPQVVLLTNQKITINNDQLNQIIYSIIDKFNQGNKTNNYNSLWLIGTKKFRSETSPEKLSEIYINYRNQNVDLSEFIKGTISFNTPPVLEATKNSLNTTGFIAVANKRLNFQMFFLVEERKWMLAGFTVSLTSVSADMDGLVGPIWEIKDRLKTPNASN